MYLIKKLPVDVERIPLRGEFLPETLQSPWSDLEEAKLAHFPWKDQDSDYMPECSARVGWNEKGIHVLMYAREAIIRAEVTRVGGDVYKDSCMEFFLSPRTDRLTYVNCEVNPLAIMHIGIGDSRYARKVFNYVPSGFNPACSSHSGSWWAVSYTLPASFLMAEFGVKPSSGAEMRGNFFKCGGCEQHAHHGVFHLYNTGKPDHHLPELFADMMLE